MNKLEYKNSGGFPLTTNRLDDIQETFAPPINGLAAMAGNLAIISGCTEIGDTVTDGFIFVGNEIFEFRSGIKQTYITLFEDKIEKNFENGQQKIVNTKRYFTFGTGAVNYKWIDFKRIPPLTDLLGFMVEIREDIKILKAQNAPINQGNGIVLFNNIASLIPPGYAELPQSEWAGRIPVHINRADFEFNTIGKIGGAKTHKITIGELPRHSFRALSGDNIHRAAKGSTASGVLGNEKLNTNVIGNDESMNIMNPYRVVIFIKWVGLGNGVNG